MPGIWVLGLLYSVKGLNIDCIGKKCGDICYSQSGISCEYECSPGCKIYMIGDLICQENCMNELCLYDVHDCRRALNTTVTIANTSAIEANSVIAPYNYGKVAGVGLGIFLTIIAIILGLILCVIGTATPIFLVCCLIGILIPLITFLIVALGPLHKNQVANKDTRTDKFVAARVIFLICMIIFAIFSIIKNFEYYLGINLKAKGVNSNIPDANLPNSVSQTENNQAENQLNPLEPPSDPLNKPEDVPLNPMISSNPLLASRPK
jgi:LNR domain